jgi:hypothetical protein
VTTATVETITTARITAAWNEYLASIKQTTNPYSYTEVEQTAWHKLQLRLKRIELTS